ncbi:MAG: hypothetical protein QOF48_218 [Verrucomicrobiota bacterium]|jgi:hypothetical protein
MRHSRPRISGKPGNKSRRQTDAHHMKQIESRWRAVVQAVLLKASIAAIAFVTTRAIDASTNVVLWDTVKPLSETLDGSDKTVWRTVPSDLLLLETDPAKASSDPGYYGREYKFKGDAVVENRHLAVAFCSANGRVLIYFKANPAFDASDKNGNNPFGGKILELAPLQSASASIHGTTIIRNSGDEIVLEASFAAKGAAEARIQFVFGRSEVMEIKPERSTKGIRLSGPIDQGIVPGFIGDDFLVNASSHPSSASLSLPAENIFLGLLEGERELFVMTWPAGKQRLQLNVKREPADRPRIASVDFYNEGQSIYLAALGAPGIWHREELKSGLLEKDQRIQWQRPFPARWKTQLEEAGIITSFTFHDKKGEVWRGVPGSYKYPVWFEGNNAFYHLSKKIPPKGQSIAYFLEGQDTPALMPTPVDILRSTLGRQQADPILDMAGRKLRTHHRRSGDGVRRACTCGCTEAIQAVFVAGTEVERREEIAADLEDMAYFVEHHVQRIDEYRRFADAQLQFVAEKKNAAPALKVYLEKMEQILGQIPQEYTVQKENMGSAETVARLTRETMALTGSKKPDNLKAYMDLLKAWRAMGGAQDYVLAQCHTIARKLCQEAAWQCLDQPEAMPVAQEIRARCRQILRNPDGYEIWADY